MTGLPGRIASFQNGELFVRESDGTAHVTVTLDEPAETDLEIPFTLSG